LNKSFDGECGWVSISLYLFSAHSESLSLSLSLSLLRCIPFSGNFSEEGERKKKTSDSISSLLDEFFLSFPYWRFEDSEWLL
jgi:hypothetical protein